jgi:hypothetical protein
VWPRQHGAERGFGGGDKLASWSNWVWLEFEGTTTVER